MFKSGQITEKKNAALFFFLKDVHPLLSGQPWVMGLHRIHFTLAFEDLLLPHRQIQSICGRTC